MHVNAYNGIQNVEIAALCDVDESQLERRGKEIESKKGKRPAFFTDLRKLLEDKSIDAILIVPPNHNHTLQTIWGVQAGKDVYGNGDFGNQGIHEVDICFWGLGVTMPSKVSAIGGHVKFDDGQETPNMLTATYEFDERGKKKIMVFEVRHWMTNHEAGIRERKGGGRQQLEELHRRRAQPQAVGSQRGSRRGRGILHADVPCEHFLSRGLHAAGGPADRQHQRRRGSE